MPLIHNVNSVENIVIEIEAQGISTCGMTDMENAVQCACVSSVYCHKADSTHHSSTLSILCEWYQDDHLPAGPIIID